MERLRVLDVQGDKLGWLWGDRNFQAPLQLRQLEIQAPLLKFPKSIGQLKYLEKIVVRALYCTFGDSREFVTYKVPLKTLPDEFCDLQCLEHLELAYCLEMECLPESFGNLKNLQHLDLSCCSKLRTLPNSLGNLKRLKHLILIWCKSLTMSSQTLGNISTLEFINMRFCTEIKVLPPQVVHQRYLSELRLTGTNIRELPSVIVDLKQLKILEIGSPSLKMLPAWLGCLRSLKELRIGDPLQKSLPFRVSVLTSGWMSSQMNNSIKLKCLPDSIGELTQLEQLSFSGTGLECLPRCIMALNNVVYLSVGDTSLRELSFKRVGGERETECMLGLTEFWLWSVSISEIAFGKGICPNLQSLHICCCRRLENVGTLPNTLMKLYLWGCSDLKKIEGLCGLAKLQTLHISGSPEVEELSGLGTLKSLDTLELGECGVTGIPGLQQLTKLRVLHVSSCNALKELAGIEHLMWLRVLTVSGCPNLEWGEGVLEHLRQREENDLLNLKL